DAGDARSQVLAGYSLYADDLTRNDGRSRLETAASGGNARAEYTLGWIADTGWVAARDVKSAWAHYLKAAQAGDPLAQAALARLYDNGEGVTQDHGAALGWLHKAADQGLPVAQGDIGYHYDVGEGVRP